MAAADPPETVARQGYAVRVAPDRELPHDLDAEKCALGSILIDNAKLRVVASIVELGDFFRHAHQLIFAGMVALAEEGRPVDPLTLKSQMGATRLEDAGGIA